MDFTQKRACHNNFHFGSDSLKNFYKNSKDFFKNIENK